MLRDLMGQSEAPSRIEYTAFFCEKKSSRSSLVYNARSSRPENIYLNPNIYGDTVHGILGCSV
jgi:hypothetical protein